MAEIPKRILKLFRTKNVNKYGIYCVRICDMGEWKDVIIDDFFPCFSEDSEKEGLCFTKSNGNEL